MIYVYKLFITVPCLSLSHYRIWLIMHNALTTFLGMIKIFFTHWTNHASSGLIGTWTFMARIYFFQLTILQPPVAIIILQNHSVNQDGHFETCSSYEVGHLSSVPLQCRLGTSTKIVQHCHWITKALKPKFHEVSIFDDIPLPWNQHSRWKTRDLHDAFPFGMATYSSCHFFFRECTIYMTRWWFQISFISMPIVGKWFPIWLFFFSDGLNLETTNYIDDAFPPFFVFILHHWKNTTHSWSYTVVARDSCMLAEMTSQTFAEAPLRWLIWGHGVIPWVVLPISYVGVSKNRDTPKWMVKIMENPIKMDDLGVRLFLETPIYVLLCWGIPTMALWICLATWRNSHGDWRG